MTVWTSSTIAKATSSFRWLAPPLDLKHCQTVRGSALKFSARAPVTEGQRLTQAQIQEKTSPNEIHRWW